MFESFGRLWKSNCGCHHRAGPTSSIFRLVFELTRSRLVGSKGRSTGTGSAFLGSSSVAITASTTSGPTILANEIDFSLVNFVMRIPVPPRPFVVSSSNGVAFALPVSVTVMTAPSPKAAPDPLLLLLENSKQILISNLEYLWQ